MNSARLGAEIRVSYDTSPTRLHAKAWIFHRESGYSTAYIGSSNLTHSAQVTGLEWNVRVSGARNPDAVAKMAAVFESYWASGDFVSVRPERVRASGPQSRWTLTITSCSARSRSSFGRSRRRCSSSSARPASGPPPQPARRGDRDRQDGDGGGRLCAPATEPAAQPAAVRRPPRGDPRPEPRDVPACAPRCARSVRSGSAGSGPSRFEHVFASIQSLNASGVESHRPDHFDVVIVDEFHHAAAPSYAALLEHLSRANCSA